MYSASQVWSIIVNDTTYEGDIEERIDVARGLHKLSHQERVFLISLAQGYSGKDALHQAGYSPGTNQTELKNRTLSKLTKIINGEK